MQVHNMRSCKVSDAIPLDFDWADKVERQSAATRRQSSSDSDGEVHYRMCHNDL